MFNNYHLFHFSTTPPLIFGGGAFDGDFSPVRSCLVGLSDAGRRRIDGFEIPKARADSFARPNDSDCGFVLRPGKETKVSWIAEGIETQDQFDLLIEWGCQFGQGYFIARPTIGAL